MAEPARSLRERAALWGLAALAGAGAYGWFASRPAMNVRVGLQEIDKVVPVHYQASAFPAFGLFAGALALDAVRGRARSTLVPRAVLIGLTGAIALLRLDARVPLSGHAVFLAAMLAHELGARSETRSPLGSALAGAGLGVTAWYKLVVWDDAGWFSASVAVGLAIGAVAVAME
jgi:hypothetical protein